MQNPFMPNFSNSKHGGSELPKEGNYD